jgi:hypothetical protein
VDCEEADRRAQALLAEFGACSPEQTCEVVPLGARLEGANEQGVCVDAFLCSVALPSGADQQAFVARARDIVERRHCNNCAVAKCARPESLVAFCDPATRRCQLRRP